MILGLLLVLVAVEAHGVEVPWHVQVALNATQGPRSYIGQGIVVYVLDTGVAAHPGFRARVVQGPDFVQDARGLDATCMTHGTHCAGLVAGSTVGIAPGATIVSVRVLDCHGTGKWDSLARAVEWVVQDRQTVNSNKVLSISVGGVTHTSIVDRALARAVDAGIVAVVAAGNSPNVCACYGTPSRVGAAITVGSVDAEGRVQEASSVGPCVDVFAPGVAILSLQPNTRHLGNRSGSSAACAIVAGMIAVLKSKYPSVRAPAEVQSLLLRHSARQVVTGRLRGAPNVLAQVDAGPGPRPGPGPCP